MMSTSERRARRERIHEPEKSRALHELGTRDPVVGADVLLGHRPALAHGVRGRTVNLARDGLLLVGDVLIGRLARVDGGDHRDSLSPGLDGQTLLAALALGAFPLEDVRAVRPIPVAALGLLGVTALKYVDVLVVIGPLLFRLANDDLPIAVLVAWSGCVHV